MVLRASVDGLHTDLLVSPRVTSQQGALWSRLATSLAGTGSSDSLNAKRQTHVTAWAASSVEPSGDWDRCFGDISSRLKVALPDSPSCATGRVPISYAVAAVRGTPRPLIGC